MTLRKRQPKRRRATDGAEGIIELLMDSKETASCLKGRLARVLRKVARSADTILIQRPVTLAVPPGIPTDTGYYRNSVKVRLPM